MNISAQGVEEIIRDSNQTILNFVHNNYKDGLIAESENEYVKARDHYMRCANMVKLGIRGMDVGEYDIDLSRAEKLIMTTKDLESSPPISQSPVPLPQPYQIPGHFQDHASKT